MELKSTRQYQCNEIQHFHPKGANVNPSDGADFFYQSFHNKTEFSISQTQDFYMMYEDGHSSKLDVQELYKFGAPNDYFICPVENSVENRKKVTEWLMQYQQNLYSEALKHPFRFMNSFFNKGKDLTVHSYIGVGHQFVGSFVSSDGSEYGKNSLTLAFWGSIFMVNPDFATDFANFMGLPAAIIKDNDTSQFFELTLGNS